MITKSPYRLNGAIKPGHLPEPIQPVHTCDPQEYIDICLSCTIEGECRPMKRECKLNGLTITKRTAKRTKKMQERDERLLYLLTHGWRNTECICEELGISAAVLGKAKKRLRERGEIE